MNAAKSCRSTILYSAGVKSLIIGLSFFAKEPSFELLDHLFFCPAECVLSGFRLCPALDVEQEFEGAPIAVGRLVDELLDDGLLLADFSPPTIFGDDDRFVECLTEQGRQIFRSAQPASRVAGLTLLEAGAVGRLAITHLIIARPVRGHGRAPPRARGHQSCSRSQHDGRGRRSASASGGSSCRHKRGRVLCSNSAGRCARRRSESCRYRENRRVQSRGGPSRRGSRRRPSPPALRSWAAPANCPPRRGGGLTWARGNARHCYACA